MRQQMARLTLDIAGSTLLGMDLRQDADDVRSALESALESFAGGAPALALRRRGGPRSPADQAASGAAERGAGLRARLDAIVAKIIEAHRDQPSADRGDVVSALHGELARLDPVPGADR
jgi:cytochrome P450